MTLASKYEPMVFPAEENIWNPQRNRELAIINRIIEREKAVERAEKIPWKDLPKGRIEELEHELKSKEEQLRRAPENKKVEQLVNSLKNKLTPASIRRLYAFWEGQYLKNIDQKKKLLEEAIDEAESYFSRKTDPRDVIDKQPEAPREPRVRRKAAGKRSKDAGAGLRSDQGSLW